MKFVTLNEERCVVPSELAAPAPAAENPIRHDAAHATELLTIPPSFQLICKFLNVSVRLRPNEVSIVSIVLEIIDQIEPNERNRQDHYGAFPHGSAPSIIFEKL